MCVLNFEGEHKTRQINLILYNVFVRNFFVYGVCELFKDYCGILVACGNDRKDTCMYMCVAH